jgi:hypothetical protein
LPISPQKANSTNPEANVANRFLAEALFSAFARFRAWRFVQVRHAKPVARRGHRDGAVGFALEPLPAQSGSGGGATVTTPFGFELKHICSAVYI